jgi:hypothetical protein
MMDAVRNYVEGRIAELERKRTELAGRMIDEKFAAEHEWRRVCLDHTNTALQLSELYGVLNVISTTE